jgi:CheY-like chemotaxis protein
MYAARNLQPLERQRPKEILVVDDDPAVREALCDVLLDEGYTVARACNGAEAVGYLAGARMPAAIILDLTMPVMDGYEFLDRRAADPGLAEIPVVVVSATIDAHVDHPGEELVRKPIDHDALLAVLERTRLAAARAR